MLELKSNYISKMGPWYKPWALLDYNEKLIAFGISSLALLYQPQQNTTNVCITLQAWVVYRTVGNQPH